MAGESEDAVLVTEQIACSIKQLVRNTEYTVQFSRHMQTKEQQLLAQVSELESQKHALRSAGKLNEDELQMSKDKQQIMSQLASENEQQMQELRDQISELEESNMDLKE